MIGPPNSARGGTPDARGREGASHSHSQASDTGSKRKRGIFQKELPHMMYGFGDDVNVIFSFYLPLLIPHLETVAHVDDIVVEYLTDFAHQTQDIESRRGLRISFILSARMLRSSTDVKDCCRFKKQAGKAFDVDEEKLAASVD